MANAFETTLAEGCSKMVLIGTDSPDIPCRIITAAFAALETKEVVVSPARDGGYVLIGESRHHPELFSAMPWGSGEVLALTRERALRAGLRYLELESWDDIDDVLSLQRFLRRSPASPVSVYARQQLKSIIKDLAP